MALDGSELDGSELDGSELDGTERRERRGAARALPALAAAWSVLVAGLGAWWWSAPQDYPLDGGASGGTVLDVVPASVVPPVLVAAGLWGAAVAWTARRGSAGPAVVVTAAVYAAVFGLAVPGMAPLALAGYAMAILGPPAVFALVVAGAWRWRGGWAVVAVFVLLAVLAWATGFADGPVLARYGDVLLTAGNRIGQPAALLLMLLGGLVWAALGVSAALRARGDGRTPEWARPERAAGWGRIATIVAAACALPYGLMRLSWLTPWPLGVGAVELADNPEIRLHGLLLGLAALAGAVLTLGLVSRWGEVWPGWVPVLRGRRVPVAAAAGPGALVAALFTVAAVPVTLQAVQAGEPLLLLMLPLPVWGPALGAAVLSYVLRRRGGTAGTIERS